MATFAALQGDVFAAVGLRAAADQELVSADTVRRLLGEAHAWVAMQTGIYRRAAEIPTVAGQAVYLLPADLFEIETVLVDGRPTPLERLTRGELEWARRHGRARVGGPPACWYRDGAQAFGVHPAPSAEGTLTVRGWVTPWAVEIAAVSRAGETVTVTTAAAHGLHAGERVTLCGVSDAAYRGDFTVIAVPKATLFQFHHDAGGEAEGGVAGFAGGVLPLRADEDVPDFPSACHAVLTHAAVLRLAGSVLADDPRAMAAALTAGAEMKGLLGEMRRLGVG